MAQVYVDCSTGTFGDGEQIVIVEMNEHEADFFGEMTDSERCGVGAIMAADNLDVWDAHTALMEETYGVDRCSNGCMCNPKEKHDSDTCEPEDCPFDHEGDQ